MENTDSQNSGYDRNRPYAVKQLAALLNVTTRTFTKWAEPVYKQYGIKKRTKVLPPIVCQAILAFLGYI